MKVLHQVTAAQKGGQMALGIDNGKFSLFRLSEDGVCFFKGDVLGSGKEVFVGGHYGGYGIVETFVELDVPHCYNA